MPKRKEGVYEKILDAAKKEFLSKGFRDASLRVIAREADTSTSSIYTRFNDKQGLFDAIIQPVGDEYVEMFTKIQEQFWQMESYDDYDYMLEYSENGQKMLLDYIYEHFDEFQLLLSAAEGTHFACFVDELVDIEVDYTYKYMEVIGCESVKSGLVTEEFIHIVVTAYFNGMFEVVRHNMEKDDAVKYLKLLNSYHMQGFSTIFNPPEL